MGRSRVLVLYLDFLESFDGSRTAFTVSNAPLTAQQLIISINGGIQKPNSGTGQPSEGFTLSGSTVTFSSAIPSGVTISLLFSARQ